MKKPKLTLVPNNKELESYEVVTVYLIDEGAFQFALNEWEMYESVDWIQFRKKDKNKSAMQCFSVSSIMHIYFESKGEVVEEKPTLKPVE